MSTGAPKLPRVEPKKKNEDQKRVFIGWLNSDKRTQPSKSQAVVDLVTTRISPPNGTQRVGELIPDRTSKRKKKNPNLKDESLQGKRRQSALDEISDMEKRIAFLKTVLIDITEAEKSVAACRKATLADLDVPTCNDELNRLLEAAHGKIAEISKSQLGVGADRVLKEIVKVEKSTEYRAAVQLVPTATGNQKTFAQRLDEAKDLATGRNVNVPIDIPKALNVITQLDKACYQLTREYAGLQLEIKEVDGLIVAKSTETAQQFKAAPQLRAYVEGRLANARTLVVEASEPPTNVRDETAIVSHYNNVKKLITDARNEVTAVGDFITTLPPTANKQIVGAILEAEQFLEEYYDTAVTKLGYVPPTTGVAKRTEVGTWAQNATTATQANATAAQALVDHLDQFFADQSSAWETARNEAAPLVRVGKRIVMSVDMRLADMGDSSDSKGYKETAAQGDAAAWSLVQYEEALAAAKKRDYPAAIEAVKLAVEGDKTPAHPGLKALASAATNALTTVDVDETDIKERKQVFSVPEAKLTSKSRLRLDSETLALITGNAGLTVDENGELVRSERFDAMEKQLTKALKVWNELRLKGADPFKAADKAFAGIPENFWPIEAVRVLAMFRRAETEFAEERAAEVEAALRSSKASRIGAKIDSALETINGLISEGSEQVTDACDTVLEGVVEYASKIPGFSEKYPDFDSLSEDKQTEAANEFIKNATGSSVDLAKTAEVFGHLSTGLGVLGDAISAGKHGKEIFDAQTRITAYDVENDSPVELRIAEFERKRAIWQLIDSMADMILKAAGPATEMVPGLSMLGDAKTIVQAVADAFVYFRRLQKARNLKAGAKYDPDTMSDIALANEAYRLGVLSGEKTFEAAMAVLKLAGGAAELGGISAPGGWALKYGSMVIEYCGKGFFAIKAWSRHRKAMKTLWAAKADPSNIELVEQVFELCTMYARFALAYGALNNDTWARQYLLSRGLTDKDLDNINTSTAILREYLNVTFQTVQGDAEEDDDMGQTKRDLAKEKTELAAPTEDYLCPWSVDDVTISAAIWEKNYDEAVANGLVREKKVRATMSKQIGEYRRLHTATNEAIVKFNDAYKLFETGVDKQAPNLETLAQTAKGLLSEAIDRAAETHNVMVVVCEDLRSWTPKAKDGKQLKIHASMKLYAVELCDSFTLDYGPIAVFRQEAGKKSMALMMRQKVGGDDFEAKARQKFDELLKISREAAVEINETITAGINDGFEKITLKTKTGGEGVWTVLITDTAKEFAVDEKTLENKLKPEFLAVKKQVLQSALFKGYQILGDSLTELEKIESNPKLNVQKKAEAKRKAQINRDRAVQDEAITFWLNNAKTSLVDIFDTTVNGLVTAKSESTKGKPGSTYFDHTFGGKETLKLDRDYWVKCKEDMIAKGWKWRKTGIGPSLEAFSEALEKIKLLPKDRQMIKAWDETYGKLLNQVKNMPLERDDGVELPGGKKYKQALIDKLTETADWYLEQQGDPNVEDPMTQGQWQISDGKLQTWPATESGWLLMHELAEKNGWKGHNNRGKFATLFRDLDDATSPAEKKTAAQALLTAMQKWDPNKKMLRTREAFPGIEAYRTKMISRLDTFVKAGGTGVL